MLSSTPPTIIKNGTLDGLPKSFIHVLRTLFDILDDKRTGLVKFSDIEARWQEESTDLPKGVIESLRKVTPSNGLLSFERFCAGLKICLLRNQMELRSKNKENSKNHQTKLLSQRPPSAPIIEAIDSKYNANNDNQWNKYGISAMHLTNYRTVSMPHLLPDNKKEETKDTIFLNKKSSTSILLGPPKPPRTNVTASIFFQQQTSNLSEDSSKTDKAEIRAALQNWQMGLMSDDKHSSTHRNVTNARSIGDGMSDYSESQNLKKNVTRRREPRRHTLQNGVDCNMLKKMKQIECEKEVLFEGLQAVERAREWYRKQIAIVQDKIKYVCRMGSHDQWSEAQQERIELLRARILEVNRHLATLGGNSGEGGKNNNGGDLPLHMNLAVHSQSRLSHAQVLTQLKRQNHGLTREVNHKTEKINNLEREKATLIRELYQIRRKSDQPICKNQSSSDNLPIAPAAYI